jgi:hypothetical protein
MNFQIGAQTAGVAKRRDENGGVQVTMHARGKA